MITARKINPNKMPLVPISHVAAGLSKARAPSNFFANADSMRDRSSNSILDQWRHTLHIERNNSTSICGADWWFSEETAAGDVATDAEAVLGVAEIASSSGTGSRAGAELSCKRRPDRLACTFKLSKVSLRTP